LGPRTWGLLYAGGAVAGFQRALAAVTPSPPTRSVSGVRRMPSISLLDDLHSISVLDGLVSPSSIVDCLAPQWWSVSMS